MHLPDDARVELARAELHGDGLPCGDGHPVGYSECVGGLRQWQHDVGVSLRHCASVFGYGLES